MVTNRSFSAHRILTGLLVVSSAAACSSLIGLDDYRVEDVQTASGGGAGDTSTGGSGGTSTGQCEPLDCDDGIACTEDICEDGTCRHVANDALCSGAGACGPSICDATQGCQAPEPPSEVTLVSATTRNGSFETGILPDPAPWLTTSNKDLVVIYDCSSPGICNGIHGAISATQGDRLLWLGGDHDHQDSAFQLLKLPPGTIGLRIVADVNFQTEETGPSNHDTFEVWLRGAVDPMPLLESPLHRSVSRDAQASSAQWSRGVVLVDDADVSELAGETVRVSFESISDDDAYTDFFVDNIRITASVCE